MAKAIVHSLESFGSVDGPGVRYVIFLQGCGMRCKFCHNPETWKCVAEDQLTSEEQDAGFGTDLVRPQLFSAEELFRKAYRYRSYWGRDGQKGGITVSGGEPLLQIDFLIEFFGICKAHGVHTTLDTSGHPFSSSADYLEKFQRLMKVTDLFMLDIKAFGSELHKEVTGRDNANILEMAQYLSDNGKAMWIRHVLVPGLTDGEADLSAMAEFVDGLKTVEKVEILPYHTLGLAKYDKLGIRYPLDGVVSPTEEEIERAQRIFQKRQI